MKVQQFSVHSVGPPTGPCPCGEGEWLKAQPGDLFGWRCSACWTHTIGQVGFDEPEEVEVEIVVERTPDGGAVLHFGEEGGPANR